MKLQRLSERIWIYPFEKERDRPNLGYIRGERLSVAVDAGHSGQHVAEFYRALEDGGLPLPAMTILSHYHWDHALGLHAIHGLSVANVRTNEHLGNLRDRVARDGGDWLLSLDASVRKEYEGASPVVVSLPDVVFEDMLTLHLGDCTVLAFRAESPHTDDSTLVHVQSEKTLFFGDAKSGTFPTWRKDPILCRKLAAAVEATGAEVCVGGHWKPMSKRELVDGLRGTQDI